MKDYNNVNIIDTDRKGRPYITLASVSFASFALLQLTLSIVFALAVFIVLALGFHMLNRIGLLDTINGLLGRTMVTYTESKLIMLSGLFAGIVGIIRFLYELVHILLVNATIRMIGGIPVKLYDVNDNGGRKAKTDKNHAGLTSESAGNDAHNADNDDKHPRVIISSEPHDANNNHSHDVINDDDNSTDDSHASIHHDSNVESDSLSRLATRSVKTEAFSSLKPSGSDGFDRI